MTKDKFLHRLLLDIALMLRDKLGEENNRSEAIQQIILYRIDKKFSEKVFEKLIDEGYLERINRDKVKIK